ncbi:MAG: SEC-C metal-binding domain-containing protein, partial [Alphaproteobacteria bacterium]|nr:SEC-C metal-binding domain-containing protein [Alphaproteobacteria bacterium]
VMNDQRKVIYQERIEFMATDEVADTVVAMRHEVIEDLVVRFIPEKAYAEQWETDALGEECRRIFGLDLPIGDWAKEEGIAETEILDRVTDAVDRRMAEKAARHGPELMRMAEKSLVLQVLDQQWKDHLLSLDHLRQGISLRAYGQRDPLNEYKSEAFMMFEGMLTRFRETVTNLLAQVEFRAEPAEPAPERRPALAGAGAGAEGAGEAPVAPAGTRVQGQGREPTDPATWGKVGRNERCPCGSGKKYKHCHGAVR